MPWMGHERKWLFSVMCLRHLTMLDIILFFKFSGLVEQWFHSSISLRYQRASITDKSGVIHFSDWLPSKICVQQGSNLGPILFLLTLTTYLLILRV